MIPSEASVVLESSQEEVTPLVDQRVSSSKYQKEGQKPLVKDNNSNSDLLVPKKEEPPPAATENTTGKKRKENPHGNGRGSKWDEFRERWRKAEQRRYARERRDNLKNNYDYRDRKGHDEELLCMFCGVNKGITQKDALTDGLQWKEYSSHPVHYRTCWTCKSNHVSVMTESMALQKFAKKLNVSTVKTADGESHRVVFQQLRDGGRTFHHQPRTARFLEETRISEYFWYPDLELEALKLGWLPRGKMKEQVPWVRKDISDTQEMTTSVNVCSKEDPKPQTPKKSKTSAAVVSP